MTRPPLELLRGALERLLACYSVENAFGEEMCPDCRENPEHMHGPGHGEGCPVPIIRSALGALGAVDSGPLESVQVIRDLGGLRVSVPMMHDTATGERFTAPDVAELAHNVTQALRAQAEAGACDTCQDVVDNIGQINYCYRCGRRFPEHVAEEITVAEFIAREAPNWADVTDPVAWVREMRGDAPDVELEAHWKAGFLRGAKFWYGRTEAGTMWQSEQNECWQAAGRLWPAVRPESLEDARQVAQAQAGAGEGQGEGA